MKEIKQINLFDYRVENEAISCLSEKIMQHDFESLVDAEYLALTVGINIAEAKSIITKYGLGNLLSVADVINLNNIQQARLHSLYQLFKIIINSDIKETDFITSPDAAFKLFSDIQFKTNEVVKVALLNTANKLISVELLSKGSLNQTHIYTRELVKLCIKTNTKSVILAHNHPSNSLKLSNNDIKTTKRIQEALALIECTVLDHLVICNGSFVSMKNKGLL